MSGVRLEDLRWFVEVAERQHVSQAATALHVSQPALSRSVARVEAWAGVPLLDRVGRTVQLNPHGRALVEHLRRAAAEIDGGRERIREAAGLEAGQLRLAFQRSLGAWLVPELLARFREPHPTVGVLLREDSRDRVLAGLRDGELDLALISPIPHDDRLDWTPLRVERLELVVPLGHRLAGRTSVRLEEAADEPFVALEHGYGLRSIFEQLCARAGFSPRLVLEGSGVVTLRGLVVAGLGVAVLPPPAPDEGYPDGHQAATVALADEGATRTIVLAWRRDGYRPPSAEAFRALATRWAADQPAVAG